MATSKNANPIFGVRLRSDLHVAIREAAKREGLGIAQWLERTLAPALEGKATSCSSLGGPGAASDAARGETYRAELDAISDRVAALERTLASKPQEGTRSKPKAEPKRAAKAEPAVAEGREAWFKPPTFTRLSENGVAEIRRRYELGEDDQAIAEAMELTQQGVNKHTKAWRK